MTTPFSAFFARCLASECPNFPGTNILRMKNHEYNCSFDCTINRWVPGTLAYGIGKYQADGDFAKSKHGEPVKAPFFPSILVFIDPDMPRFLNHK